MKNNRNDESYLHILKYTSLFGIIQFLCIMLGIVKNKVVAVILGPMGVGMISLFNSTLNFVSNATNFGVATSGVKNISDAYTLDNYDYIEKQVLTVRLWCLFAGIFGSLFCILFCGYLDKITFSWGNHTFHFLCLSPVIFITSVTGGELAILKGLRKLSYLAKISLLNIIATIIICIIIYYYFKISGIVPCLLITAFIQMLFTVGYSYRVVPLKLHFNKERIASGTSMIKVGIAFVLSSIFATGADFFIRSYINNVASLAELGLYSAGYVIVMTYGGLIFAAMETDYYPRLSSITDSVKFCNTVNSQCEVSILLISPMLSFLILFIPVILPLLYSEAFQAVVPMVQIALIALYIRAVKLPVAYISLAKSNSLLFLCGEGFYSICIVLFSIIGYNYAKIVGIGWAIVVAGLLEYILLFTLNYKIYQYCISKNTIQYFSIHFLLGISVLWISLHLKGWIYWAIGCLCIILSTAFSIKILYCKTSIFQNIIKQFKKDRVSSVNHKVRNLNHRVTKHKL